jgi:hypothetical protein
MVPKIAAAGRSFKGAALYYLHDKKADTRDRVAFVHTINLPTDDADRAVAHMVDTAVHADALKQAAGLKAGRKLEKPVYCYSLAWHPSEAPTQAEQIDAARDTLKALGLTDRQALIVSHNDTDHPHVHVIVNRVCPETGRAALTSNDRLILSQWAEKYERDRGQVFCEARVLNNEERQQGKFKKDQESQSRKAYFEWKKQTTAELWQQYRDERDAAKASRKPQLDALWQQREQRMAARKAEIKQIFKPYWRDLFKRQRRELRDFDASLIKRLSFALTHYEKGKAMAVLRAFTDDHGMRQDFIKSQEQGREVLSEQHRQMIREAGRDVSKVWRDERDRLRVMHKAEDKERISRYRSDTDAVWNRRQGEGVSDEFNASQAPENAKKPTQREVLKEHMRNQRERTRGRTRRRPR